MNTETPLQNPDAGAGNAPDAPHSEPETARPERGSEKAAPTIPGSASEAVRAHAAAEMRAASGFSKAGVAPFVPICLAFPHLWPETAGVGVRLNLEYLLSADADREQTAFLGMTDAEQEEARYSYDCRMLALLVATPPEGIIDFPETPSPFDPDDAEHRNELREAVYSYFYAPGDERARALRYVARHFMSRYWQKIAPRDYL